MAVQAPAGNAVAARGGMSDWQLFHSGGFFSDVKVMVAGTVYYLHYDILMRNKYFKAALRGGWLEAREGKVTIENPCDPEYVYRVLKFIYVKEQHNWRDRVQGFLFNAGIMPNSLLPDYYQYLSRLYISADYLLEEDLTKAVSRQLADDLGWTISLMIHHIGKGNRGYLNDQWYLNRIAEIGKGLAVADRSDVKSVILIYSRFIWGTGFWVLHPGSSQNAFTHYMGDGLKQRLLEMMGNRNGIIHRSPRSVCWTCGNPKRDCKADHEANPVADRDCRAAEQEHIKCRAWLTQDDDLRAN